MDLSSIQQTLEQIKLRGWSADNLTFGMGGGLLQKVNRDTQRFAFKASSIVVDGETRDVFKSPVTDPSKGSKRGRLALIRTNERGKGGFQTYPDNKLRMKSLDVLETVFEDGKLLKTQSLSEIRARVVGS